MLPADILDCIFSYLDLTSLEAVSSTNSLFSSIAERHRYAEIVLTLNKAWDDNSKAVVTPTALLHLLSKRRHVSNYILCMTIDISTCKDNIDVILPLLQNLKKITIGHINSFNTNANWSKLPKSTILSLENCLHLQSLQELDVISIPELPLSFLRQCTGIKTLKLLNCFISDKDNPWLRPNVYSAPRLLLQDLSIANLSDSSLKIVVPWIAEFSHNLQCFHISPNCYNGNEINFLCTIGSILRSCSALTTLKVSSSFQYRRIVSSDPPPFDCRILNLPRLREASFHTEITFKGITPTIIPFFIIGRLLPIMPNLQWLSLRFTLDSTMWLFNSLDHLELDWSEFDILLDTHRCLSRFNIDLCIGSKSRLYQASDQNTKTSLMKYPNIRKMMEQNALVISSLS